MPYGPKLITWLALAEIEIEHIYFFLYFKQQYRFLFTKGGENEY